MPERQIPRLTDLVSHTTFLDETSLGLVVVGKDGNALEANDRAIELLGVTRAEFIGETVMESHAPVTLEGSPIPPEELPGFITLRTGQPTRGVVMGIEIRDRPRRWLSVAALPYEVDQRLIGVLIAIEDQTDLVTQGFFQDAFVQTMKLLAKSMSEHEHMQALCELLVQGAHFDLAWVSVANEDDIFVKFISAAGAIEYLDGLQITMAQGLASSQGPTGTALRTGETQVMNDSVHDDRMDQWRKQMESGKFRSSVSIPFTSDNHHYALTIYSEVAHSFTDVVVESLENLVDEFQYVLAAARSASKVRLAFDGTTSTLSMMSELRDPYTAGHQHRVGTLGAAIASRLGLEQELVDLVFRSGELHDIGKIKVPVEILNRSGRLSRLEFEMIKEHVSIGYDILRNASLPWPIPEVALQHHERMDGSGYPQGLKGEEICLPARIIAVADVIEAMTQHRPYRPGLGLDAALDEVTGGAGVRYDAQVVAAAVEELDAGSTWDRLINK